MTDYRFHPKLLLSHLECVVGAALCVAVAFKQKRCREISLPLVLLLTDSLVHAMHRPWWDYYYVHLAIPLAWLTGWMVHEFIQIVIRLRSKHGFKLSSTSAWKQLALCLLAALAINASEHRLAFEFKELRQSPSVNINPIAETMREYAGQTRCVFSYSGLYPFYAQLPVPPKLAIISFKRFWSGQITTKEIVQTCGRYKPGMLILPSPKVTGDWKDLLETNYVKTIADQDYTLFVAKRLGMPK